VPGAGRPAILGPLAPPDGGARDELDEALRRLRGFGPEFGPGFANHGPMAAEALVALDRADAVPGFVDRYVGHLEPFVGAGSALGDDEWEGALGAFDRFADWRARFDREVAEDPVDEALARWVPRLAPGAIAAAGHGLLRTAHARRSLSAADTPARRQELASGLAYWAARYQELPGPPLLVGDRGVEAALAGLPVLPEEAPDEFLIASQVKHVEMVAAPFEQAVAALADPPDASAALVALAAGGARGYLSNVNRGHGIALLHAVTIPMALDLLLPAVDPADRPTVFAYLWQAMAAIHVAYTPDREDPTPGPAGSREHLVEAAVESGDEHAIKLAEAALRAFDRSGDPALTAAATDAADRFVA